MIEKKINKYTSILKDNNLFVILYEIVRRFLIFIYKFFCTCFTWLKLKGNGAVFSKLSSNGVPLIDVRPGATLIFGKNFSMNNGRYFNKIGRQQPCGFIVAKEGVLKFGDNVGLSHSSFFCMCSITVGDNVMIGGNCVFYDTDFHSLNFENRRDRFIDYQTKKSKPISIENDVFIGAHTIILKGVTIGARSIIGAGSVVSKSIPPDEIWGGNPACFIKKLADVVID